jgi:hypothetical protein
MAGTWTETSERIDVRDVCIKTDRQKNLLARQSLSRLDDNNKTYRWRRSGAARATIYYAAWISTVALSILAWLSTDSGSQRRRHFSRARVGHPRSSINAIIPVRQITPVP